MCTCRPITYIIKKTVCIIYVYSIVCGWYIQNRHLGLDIGWGKCCTYRTFQELTFIIGNLFYFKVHVEIERTLLMCRYFNEASISITWLCLFTRVFI